MTTRLPEVRFCRMCYMDDFMSALVQYAPRHYAHPADIADGWWFDRIQGLRTYPLERVRDAADQAGFTQLVGQIDAELVSRKRCRRRSCQSS